jgi:hypothetical protein
MKAKKIEAFLFSELQPWIIHGVIDCNPLFHLREQKICHLQKQCLLQKIVPAAISFYNCDFISHLQFIFTTAISFHISKTVCRNQTKICTSVKSFHICKIIVHQQKKCTTAKEIVKAAKEAAKTIFYCNITLHDKTPKHAQCLGYQTTRNCHIFSLALNTVGKLRLSAFQWY